MEDLFVYYDHCHLTCYIYINVMPSYEQQWICR
jgi:hypothetical protein